MAQKGTMSAGKWFILYVISGFIDILQIILNLFAVGVVANRFIDAILGFGLPIYLHLNGIPMFETKNLLLYMSVFIGEEIPLVDTLPLWTFEVWRMHKNYLKDQLSKNLPIATPIAQFVGNTTSTQQTPPRMPQPLNQEGVRQPPQRQKLQNIKATSPQELGIPEITYSKEERVSEKSSTDDIKEVA